MEGVYMMIGKIILTVLCSVKLKVLKLLRCKYFGVVTINDKLYVKSKNYAKIYCIDHDVLLKKIRTIIWMLPENSEGFIFGREFSEKPRSDECYIGEHGLHYITRYMAIEDFQGLGVDYENLRSPLKETYQHLLVCDGLQEQLDLRRRVWKRSLYKYSNRSI